MNKTLVTWLIVILAIILGVLLIRNYGKDTTNNIDTGGQSEATYPAGDTTNPNPGPADTGVAQPTTPSGTTSGTVKSFTVTGSNFSFTPSSLTVNKGDTVKITFVNQNGMHDWRLDEFNAKTKVIQGGQSETIEFVADKTGTFEYYCSVGTHRQMGMKGTLTVK